jgi:formate dehydrogenase major subunit
MPTQIRIDGRPFTVPDGASVLDAVRAAGVDVPTLCHDDRLAPSGACRLCLVEDADSGRSIAACAARVAAGMDIRTTSDALESYRHAVLTFLAARYPAAAIARDPDTPFHQLLRRYAIAVPEADGPPARIDRSHPLLTVDMSRCIHCYRCVRICDEVQAQGVWGLRGRGRDIAVVPDRPTLGTSTCVGCGACADTCPSGAIEDAAVERIGRAAVWTRTVCPYCGTGCELLAGTRDGALVSMRPVLHAPVNRGHLCAKGRYAFEFVHAPDRLTAPMIRTHGEWQRVSWDEAVAFTAARLQGIIARHGPDSVGVLGSARATNEENYLAQKVARLAVGTNNVDCCARVCHGPSAAALKGALGAGLATNSFDDIERARTILVWGANSTESHPIIGARIMRAARRGARLIVVDPRTTELAAAADLHLQVRPGTDISLANALARCILDEGLADADFLAARTTGLDALRAAVGSRDVDEAAAACGIDPQRIRDAARLYAGGAPAICFHGLGVTEHVQGTDAVTALINLALLTGNVGKPGCGVNPLRGQNNVQGAAHMGCDPAVLPGSMPLERGREAYERGWGSRIPERPGRHLLALLDGAAAGDVKALWAIGYDVFLSSPHAAETARALGRLDLVIVQDLFLTETARQFGSIFLPACSSFEKDGTFMNAERRVQRVRRAIAPLGDSRPDWQILCAVARAMGHADGFSFASAEEIWDEVRTICEGARGMSYGRLDDGGLQWPCPDLSHPGTPILHTDTFACGERASLRPIAAGPAPEAASADFPFILVTGRTRHQFNAGTMTRRSALDRLRPADVLDMAAGDAARLGVRDGDTVTLTSRYGHTRLPVHVSPAVVPGQLFATFHTAAAFVNRVTGPHRDAVTGTPAYKITAVRVTA